MHHIKTSKTFATFFFLSALAIIFVADRSSGAAQSPNRAALVVKFGDGSTATRCVSFDEDTITGYELLERSGFSFVASFETQGAAICQIEADGCPANDCFCQSPPDYWSYWHLNEGDWVYSYQGSGLYTVEDGIVDGWAWGPGEPPPMTPFDQICTDLAPTSTPTASNTQQPEPAATETPLPTVNPTSTSEAYPPPARATNTPNVSDPVQPTDTPLSATPPSTATAIPADSSTSSIAAPSNPRLIMPAVHATPTRGNLPDSPTAVPPTESPTLISTATSNSLTMGTPNSASGLPFNYVVFGVLAGSLAFVVIVQSYKRRQ